MIESKYNVSFLLEWEDLNPSGQEKVINSLKRNQKLPKWKVRETATYLRDFINMEIREWKHE